MKKLFIILLLLMPVISFAQMDNRSPQYRIWGPAYINTQGYLTLIDTAHYAMQIGDSSLGKGMILPIGDTVTLPPTKGGFVYNLSDSSVYYSDGHKWLKNGINIDTVNTISQLESYNKLPSVNLIYVTDSLRGGLFSLQNNNLLIPDSCTIFKSTINGEYWVRSRDNPSLYLVTWAGASPLNSAINNRKSIQETINSAFKKSNTTITNSTVIIPNVYNNFANYLIDSTIYIPPQVNFIMDGQIYYASSIAQPAIIIGNKTSNNYRSNFKINLLANEDNNNWGKNSIGVELLNMDGCSIDIEYISGFQTGALVGSYNGYDNIYNKFDLGLVNNCEYGISLTGDNLSAITDNIFNGGNITVNPNMQNNPFDTLNQYGVVFDSSYIAGNTFNNITIQLEQSFKKNNAVSIPILLRSGINNNNIFNHCWFESNNKIDLKIDPNSNSSFNTVNIDNNYPFPPDSTNTGINISDSSFRGTNNVLLNNKGYSLSPVTTVFNSGYLLSNITEYNNSSFSVKRLSFINYSTGLVSINSSGISLLNNGVEFTNPFASFLVNTSNDKNFNLYTGIDSTMRENIYIIAYDSSGVPINPFHYKTIYSSQIKSTDSSAFGGIGNMYSVGVYDNSVLFKVSDSAKKIRICISNSRPITNIQLLSYNGETTYSYSDFDSLNNILGVSQTIPTQNYPSGTWIKNDFTGGSNAIFWYRNNNTWDSLNRFSSNEFIQNQFSSPQTSSNYWIDGNGRINGNLGIGGDSLHLWAKTYSLNSSGSGFFRFMVPTYLNTSSDYTTPAGGVDLFSTHGSLEFNNANNISFIGNDNTVSGVVGYLSMNGTGTSNWIYSDNSSAVAGVLGISRAFGNSNYGVLASVGAYAPYTYTQGSYTAFTGHVDTSAQILLYKQSPTLNFDSKIGSPYGILQLSNYPNSFNGGLQMPIRTVSTSTTITTADYTVINTTGSNTFTMPAASACQGQVFHFISNSGTVTLSVGYNNFSGTNTTTISAGSGVTIQSTGTAYYQIGQ